MSAGPDGAGRGLRGMAFTGSAALRTAAAALYALLALVAVRAVEGPAAAAAAPAPAATARTTRVAVAIEASYPVAAWTVQRGGVAVAASASDARHWRGELDCGGAAAELFVQADNQDPVAGGLCALRVETAAGGRTQRTVLAGDGLVSGTVAISLPAAP
jgi:hypothetical protein